MAKLSSICILSLTGFSKINFLGYFSQISRRESLSNLFMYVLICFWTNVATYCVMWDGYYLRLCCVLFLVCIASRLIVTRKSYPSFLARKRFIFQAPKKNGKMRKLPEKEGRKRKSSNQPLPLVVVLVYVCMYGMYRIGMSLYVRPAKTNPFC